MTKEQMKEKLKSKLSDHRYVHSLGVLETAIKMAQIFGVDIEKARIAALLHDCAKQIPHNEQSVLCKKYNIPTDDIKENQSGLLHADLGAYLAEHEFGVDDKEILDAIRYHTLGREKMSDLEKILYLADIIEPNRKEFDGLSELKKLCFLDLDRALLLGFELSISHVSEIGGLLHPQTIAAKEYVEKKIMKGIKILDNSFEKVKIAVRALDKKKASDITCLDVSGLTILADYFVICSAASSTQLKALAEGIDEEFVKEGITTPTHEGRGGAEWLLLDCGDVIVHIFYKEMREFYGLDKLWDDAKKIDINTLID